MTALPEGAVSVLDQGFVRLVDIMGDDRSIVQAARVSFGAGTKGEEQDRRLISYLLKHDHGTPFEMVAFKFHVRAPIFVARQWFRHRWGCLSGDTEVTFNRPDMWRRSLQWKQYGNKTQRLTMARLWRLWNDPRCHAKVKGMLLRVYDEGDAAFTVSRLEDVVATGVKPLFRIRTKSGKTLECTADHRLLTGEGWKTLRDAVGLGSTAGGRATWERDVSLVANGTTKPWQSGTWMAQRRREGLSVAEMAAQAGCAYATVRNWLKRHHLSFSGEETGFQPGHVPWNTGTGSVTQRKATLRGKSTVHAVEDPVVAVEYVGEKPTFDLVVKGPHHNFLANGLVVHNSFNEISGRYVEVAYRFWQPSSLRRPDSANKQGSVEEPMDPALERSLLERMQETTDTAYATYQALLEAGVTREMARSVLPLGLYTEFYWKVNARSLMNFLRLRAEIHAQAEIRAYAVEMLHIFAERLPWTAAAFREHVLDALSMDPGA